MSLFGIKPRDGHTIYVRQSDQGVTLTVDAVDITLTDGEARHLVAAINRARVAEHPYVPQRIPDEAYAEYRRSERTAK